MARVIEVILGLLDEFIVATFIVVSILIIMYYAELINLTILIIGILIYISIVTLIGYRVIKVQIEKPKVGLETLLGAIGVAVDDICYEGFIKVDGELWRAKAFNNCIPKGEKVTVTGINGLILIVKKYKEFNK